MVIKSKKQFDLYSKLLEQFLNLPLEIQLLVFKHTFTCLIEAQNEKKQKKTKTVENVKKEKSTHKR